MKLLIITQAIDLNNPILGFFHGWIREFSKNFEKITVICLEEGGHNFPQNVQVFSLGKEKFEKLNIENWKLKITRRIKYVWRFYNLIWKMRREYDAVFVHMNQEYVLLGGPVWKIFGKNIYLWRNHYAGSLLTDISAFFCKKVFCTSKFSYTAKYKKTVLMPVGIDTNIFKPDNSVKRKPNSILFLGRISPVKNITLLIEALKILKNKKIDYQMFFYGDSTPKNESYFKEIKEKAIGLNVIFHPAIKNTETVSVYNEHEVFVNLTGSGSMDKTIFEAVLCGCLPLVSNSMFKEVFSAECFLDQEKPENLAFKLEKILILDENKKREIRIKNSEYAQKHSLNELNEQLIKFLK